MCAQRHRLRRSPGAWCSALASLVLAMPVRSNPIAPHPLSYFGTKDRMIVLLLNVTHSHVRPAASATPLSRGMVLRSRFAHKTSAQNLSDGVVRMQCPREDLNLHALRH